MPADRGGSIQRGLTDLNFYCGILLCRLLPTVPPPEAFVGEEAPEVLIAIASTSLPFCRHHCRRLALHLPWVAILL